MQTTYFAMPFIDHMAIACSGVDRCMRPLWVSEVRGEAEINCGPRLPIQLV